MWKLLWLFIDYSLRNLKTQINLKVSISMRSFFHCTQFRHQNADKISTWLQPQFVLIKPYDELPTFPWNFASKQVFQANLTSHYKTLNLRLSDGWPYDLVKLWKDKLQSCVSKVRVTSPWRKKNHQSWNSGFAKKYHRKLCIKKNRYLVVCGLSRATLADNVQLLKNGPHELVAIWHKLVCS